MKTFVLAGISAKFIHSNLALRYLSRFQDNDKRHHLLCVDFTINQRVTFILEELFKMQPDAIFFSAYIWNIEMIKQLGPELKKILPHCLIGLGGPEVTYDSQQFLEQNPWADLIMRGEGEWTFTELLDTLDSQWPDYRAIQSLTFREEGKIIANHEREGFLDMALLPFPYDKDCLDAADKIIYYESSRGCPYRCGYCLSSLEKRVRFMPLERVYEDIQRFLDANVRQVKFIDRTFNCHRGHTMGVWQYIAQHDNGITNFHFELTADLLDDEMIRFLNGVRKGLFQFEIGVQSTNPHTISAINRNVDFIKLSDVVKKIKAGGNIHQHLDLIAGLPHDYYQSFKQSFNDVYTLAPEQLQLGFLKVLKGSAIHQMKTQLGIVYTDFAPYEVLATNDLPHDDVVRLKYLEEMVEIYYNSGKFNYCMAYLVPLYDSAFDFYEKLSQYWVSQGAHYQSHSKIGLCDHLYGFVKQNDKVDQNHFKWLLKFDLCLHEKPKKLPEWLDVDYSEQYQKSIVDFYHNPSNIVQYLPQYEQLEPKTISRKAHLEVFDLAIKPSLSEPQAILFNYEERDLLNNAAYYVVNI